MGMLYQITSSVKARHFAMTSRNVQPKTSESPFERVLLLRCAQQKALFQAAQIWARRKYCSQNRPLALAAPKITGDAARSIRRSVWNLLSSIFGTKNGIESSHLQRWREIQYGRSADWTALNISFFSLSDHFLPFSWTTDLENAIFSAI